MTPFALDLEPFKKLLDESKKDPNAYQDVVAKGTRRRAISFAEARLDKESFEPGDIFQSDDSYQINIRPDCDCIPRGHDKLDSLELLPA